MNNTLALLALLLAPFLAREYVHWRVSRGERGQVLAGARSVALWALLYAALLGWAGLSLQAQPPGLPELCGWLVLWAGALLRIWALRALGAHYSVFIAIQPGQRVVRSGPYRYLRHPLHLGLLIEMAGLTMIAGVAALILLGLALATLVARNLQEERLLAQHMGEPYRRYRASAWDVIDLLPMKHEAGSRKQEAGSRKQEAGSRKQEAGSRKQEAGSRKGYPRAGHARSRELVRELSAIVNEQRATKDYKLLASCFLLLIKTTSF